VAEAPGECRVCGGPTEPLFEGTVLRSTPVTYRRCGTCGTLQLLDATWLERAYAGRLVPDPDEARLCRAGILARTARRLLAVGLLPPKPRCLDLGAGPGILVRLLRDAGMEAWGYEPMDEPRFAETFLSRDWPAGVFDLVVASEVLEHSLDPAGFVRRAAASLAARGVLLLTTELLDEEAERDLPRWPYLAADYGQHITFLAPQALRGLALKGGLEWWLSFDFAGKPVLHLFGRGRPRALALGRLRFRQRRGEARWGNDRRV